MTDALRKGWCPGALRPMLARDGFLVRLKLTGGRLDARKAQAIASLAAFYGNGLFDLSARANLQMRGVNESDIAPLVDALADLALVDLDAEGEAVRNLIASPMAGLGDVFDITTIVADLEAMLAGYPALHALPSKFGFLVDDGGEPTLAGITADVRFDVVSEGSSHRIWIGLGGTRDQAVPFGFCAPDEIVEAARWIGRTFLSLAANCNPPARRMSHLIERLGRYQTARAFGGTGDVDRLLYSGAIFNKAPAGFAAFGGVPVLGLAMPLGRLDHTMLRAAADIAETSTHGHLRLTPWRCILIPGIKEIADADALLTLGFILDPDDPLLRVAACPGQAGCERGTTGTHADARALADAAKVIGGSGIAIHVSGCEKGCAKPSRTSFTLTARQGSYDLVQGGKAADTPVKRGLDIDGARAFILSLKAPAA